METTILALSMNTRMTGLALFINGNLIDYSLKFYKDTFSQKKLDILKASLQSSIHNITVKHIVLSMPPTFYQTKEFLLLVEVIERFANEHFIAFTKYTTKDIYFAFASRVNPSRKSLMHRMVLFYRELEEYEFKELRNKNKYYIKLFEAVATGAYHVLKLQEKQG
jgi:uncharacterized membrane protein